MSNEQSDSPAGDKQASGEERVSPALPLALGGPELARMTGLSTAKLMKDVTSIASIPLGLAASQQVRDALATQLKFADLVTPQLARSVELAATAQIAQAVAASAGLQVWRQSLAGSSALTEFAEQHQALAASLSTQMAAYAPRMPLLQVSASLSHLGQIAGTKPFRDLLRPQTADTMAALANYTRHLPTSPSINQSQTLGMGALATRSVLADDLLAVVTRQEISDVGVYGLAPADLWLDARDDAGLTLYDRLGAIDEQVPNFLKGAWEEVAHGSYAAASKAANCLVEALDHTLRCLAPNEDVMAWLPARPASGHLDQQGRPTRGARVRYVLRSRTSEVQVAVALEISLAAGVNGVLRELERGKHTGDGDLDRVRHLIVVTEGLLTILLGPSL